MSSMQCQDVCVLCGGRQARHLIDFTVKGLEGTTRSLVRCRCGLVHVEPIPTIEQIVAFHDADEWWFEEDEVRIPVFDEVLDAVGRYSSSGRILDVGCGAGTLLDRARTRGFEPVGVELSRDAGRLARERHRLDVRAGTVTSEQFPDRHFNAIVALEMIDYPRSPIEELREFRRIISPEGVLVLACRCNRWFWVFAMANQVHRLRYGEPMKITDSAASRFLRSWGTFTANYQLTTSTLWTILMRAGWVVREIRNQQTGWSGPENTGIRSKLFSTYRAGCNLVESFTLGRYSIGPKILVVAQPDDRHA